MVSATPFTLATAYDRPWFFAATDLAELKAILDRADGRFKNSKVALDADEAYRAAAAHMPSSYAASFYLQPKTMSDRIAALRAAIQSPVSPNERTMLEQVRGISGATSFENGKIHDLLFLEMPELEHAKITRSSLTLGTKDTVFYLSMLLNVGQKFEALSQAAGLGGAMQKLFQTFSNSGITADDWKAAFGLELGSLADWPSSAHWPSLLLTLPVIDATKAGEIVEAITRGEKDAIWTQTEKNGVRYFSMQSPASLIAVTPTIALSSRILIAGFNPVSVEEAIKRSGGTASSDLSNSQTYKNAATSVPSPSNFFAYVDTALLYSRLDASLRPMLFLAAAFMPGITNYVNLGKLPAPEVITKHLGPIVSSQRYERDGYVAESVGPLTLDQSAIGLAILGSVGVAAHQKAGTSLKGWSASPTGAPQPSPTAD